MSAMLSVLLIASESMLVWSPQQPTLFYSLAFHRMPTISCHAARQETQHAAGAGQGSV